MTTIGEAYEQYEQEQYHEEQQRLQGQNAVPDQHPDRESRIANMLSATFGVE